MIAQVVFSLHEYQDKYVFGKKGPQQMLWQNKQDLEKFKELTTTSLGKSIILMGKNTFCSLPKKLSDRVHYVFSNSEKEKIKNQKGETPDFVINQIDQFKELQSSLSENDLVSIIGGYDLISQLIKNQYIHIHDENCDHSNHSHDNVQNTYEILDMYITILSGDFNSTGHLIEIEKQDLQELLENYRLFSIDTLEENVLLYHYTRKDK